MEIKMGRPAEDPKARERAVRWLGCYQEQFELHGHNFDELARRFLALWDSGVVHLEECMATSFYYGFLHALQGKGRDPRNYSGESEADFFEYAGDDPVGDFEGDNGNDAEDAAHDAMEKYSAAAWLLGWDQGHDYMLSKGEQK